MAPMNPGIEAALAGFLLNDNSINVHDEGDQQHFRIVIQYNVLRRSDGTGGFTQLELIDEHMRHLNWGFRDTPFVFVRLPGVRYIDNDDFYFLDTVQEAHTLYRTFHTLGVANIYMHEPTLFNNTNARAYTSPTPPHRGHAYGDTRIGLPANVAFSPHELGHFFFLYHPFETAANGIECADGRNCSTTGDRVCDTPASPSVFAGNTLRTGEYIGTAQGPCVGDTPFDPLTDLWMEAGWSYGDPGALIRNRFTAGQVERMVQVLHTFSSDLIGGQRPDVLVDCDGDSVDDIDEILAGIEADINEDKVPDACQHLPQAGDLLVSGMTSADTNAPRYFDPQSGEFRGVFRTGARFAHQLRNGPDGLIYLPSLAVVQQMDPVTGYLVRNLVDGAPQNAGTFVDILFDAGGNLLVLDNVRRDIKRYSRTTGEFLGRFATVSLSSPKYMEYGPDGQIYVVGNGAGDDRVIRIDALSGQELGDFVAPGSGGLGAGQGLLFSDDGFLYVSEGSSNAVLRYDAATGAFDRAFVATAGNGGLGNPHSLKFGADGHLYVASRGTDSVKRFNGNTGAYIDDFIPPGSGGPAGTGTITQPAGLLFVHSDSLSSGPEINPGMNGAWANLGTLGQGVFFDVIEESSQLFMGWFTYETAAGQQSDPQLRPHRWLVALGPYGGDTADLELLAVSGGRFNLPDPVTETPVGNARVIFRSCTEAEFEYQFDGGPSGSFRVSRLLPGTLCESLTGVGATR